MMEYSEDFAKFCQNATDTQLVNILRKEWKASQHDPDREGDYLAALVVATQRGWNVRKGEVI